MNSGSGEVLLQRLKEQLGMRNTEARIEWKARPAAVLIPLYWDQARWNLLLTRRTELLDSHRGQVSFPGGGIEPQDRGPVEAALRETEEEIGIQADTIQVLGRMNTIITVTQYEIAPIVGVLPWPQGFQINKTEVARVFGVPVNWLADPANLELRHRLPMSPVRSVPVYYYKPFDGEVIWGATARIILAFLDLLGNRPQV
jgi:8-oxo-dGTP pyrophosphatase MutT (NUDIX family)